jgi:hypothetical protein
MAKVVMTDTPESNFPAVDNTAGGTNGSMAPVSSNVVYDHGVATTDVHGAADYAQVAKILFTSNVADFTMANSANAQSPFEAARDILTVAGDTTYILEALIQITGMGGTTHTTALEFDAGNCTFTSISYHACMSVGAAQTVESAFLGKHCIVATAEIINATTASPATTIWIKGIVRINGAGTFIPQVKFSADPTGTILCKCNSFLSLMPLGVKTIGSIGNWG